MPSNIEGRIVQLETILNNQARLIRDLQVRLAMTESGIRQAQGLQYNWQPGGGSGGVPYLCVTPSSGTWAGGAPPSGTPGHFTSNVYRINAGAYELVTSSADVYNGYPSSPGTSKVLTLGKNVDGTYTNLGESCL